MKGNAIFGYVVKFEGEYLFDVCNSGSEPKIETTKNIDSAKLFDDEQEILETLREVLKTEKAVTFEIVRVLTNFDNLVIS